MVTLQALQRRPKPGLFGIVVRLAGSPEPQGHGVFELVLRFGRRKLLPQMREQVFCRAVDGVNSREHSGQIMCYLPSDLSTAHGGGTLPPHLPLSERLLRDFPATRHAHAIGLDPAAGCVLHSREPTQAKCPG